MRIGDGRWRESVRGRNGFVNEGRIKHGWTRMNTDGADSGEWLEARGEGRRTRTWRVPTEHTDYAEEGRARERLV